MIKCRGWYKSNTDSLEEIIISQLISLTKAAIIHKMYEKNISVQIVAVRTKKTLSTAQYETTYRNFWQILHTFLKKLQESNKRHGAAVVKEKKQQSDGREMRCWFPLFFGPVISGNDRTHAKQWQGTAGDTRRQNHSSCSTVCVYICTSVHLFAFCLYSHSDSQKSKSRPPTSSLWPHISTLWPTPPPQPLSEWKQTNKLLFHVACASGHIILCSITYLVTKCISLRHVYKYGSLFFSMCFYFFWIFNWLRSLSDHNSCCKCYYTKNEMKLDLKIKA